ncbi:MAG: hypothetical protein JETCAE03_32450 [Ignavibacteriaceae bacterium]|nr:MAG: hypothetical protein JETCAE03_32450 [Ignavibacteriaceae bacterium]
MKETKNKKRRSFKGENNPMYGVLGDKHPAFGYKHTEEAKKRISESHVGSNNTFFGKTHSKKNKKRWSKIRRGTNNGMYNKSLIEL